MADLIIKAGSAEHDTEIVKCPNCLVEFRPLKKNIITEETDVSGCGFDEECCGCYPSNTKWIKKTVKCPTPNCNITIVIKDKPNKSFRYWFWPIA